MVKKIVPNRFHNPDDQLERPGLLMINYYFPPVKVVGAIRTKDFYTEASKYFYTVKVITTSNLHIFQKEPDNLPNVNPAEIKSVDFRYLLHWFYGKNVLTFSYQKKKHPFKQWLIRVLNSFPFNILINDGGLIYQWLAFRKAVKIIRESNITHVYTSFKPYSDHMVAYWLKRRFPTLIWIADFRDLQTDPNIKKVILPQFQHWVNRMILKKADVLTAVSQQYADFLIRYNPSVFRLRNGIQQLAKRQAKTGSEKFTIVYTGTVYPELQNASLLFQALQQLIKEQKLKENTIKVKVVGKNLEIWKEWAAMHQAEFLLELVKEVSHREAIHIQQQSELNLLLSWSSDKLGGVLTRKLYEYLSSQNPIVTIINGTRDREFENLFEQTNAGVVFYNNNEALESLKNFIYQLYKEWEETGWVNWSMNKSALEALKWENEMASFMEGLSLSPLHLEHKNLSLS